VITVTGDQVAAMRTYFKGDAAGYKEMVDRLDPAARRAYAALIVASFLVAAENRFGKGATRGDVAEFIENLRARSEKLAGDIDPHQAERLIMAVHTDENVDDVDNGLYSLLLAGMIADAQLSDAELDEFLENSRKLADQMLA
jgi:AcrR family transcriptional regulator